MTNRADDVQAELSLFERHDVRWPLLPETPSCGEVDWRSLFERERARADAAESRCEELRWAEVDSRARAGSLKWWHDTCRKKLQAAVEETKEVRRAAKDALSLKAEVERLEKLLSEAGVESGKRSTVMSLRMEVVRLRKAAPASEARQVRAVLEGSRSRKDSIKTLRKEMGRRDREVVRLEGRLAREAQASETHKETIRWQGREVIRLHAELRRLRDQAEAVRSLSGEVYRLHVALEVAGTAKERLKTRLLRASEAARSRSPSREDAELRKALRRSRRRKTAIKSLSRENARLRKAVRKSETRQTALEVQLAKLRASGAVLSKALFGRRSEQQERPRSERRRGRQPGAAGHGRTPRPALEERIEERNPPADARVCSCCGKPYVANGAEVSTIVEVHVAAHKRVIRRPRWCRRCACASSPMEVSAPPAPRLFAGTPYGTSVWARFLFERYACFRPLNRVAAWLSDQGLPISPGTLGDSAHRFAPLFERVAEAILARQNEASVRHGDETAWRVQSLREEGRSSRAWLWTSVSEDAVYFQVDPSRGAEVAKTLFGAAVHHTAIVCDRYSAYKKMARELDGAVILCWCWAHQRRDFIHCAAGQVGLTQWCRRWIERIALLYHLNKARLVHYDPGLERQSAAFDAAQAALKKALDGLFADAGRELAALPRTAREGKALRSLLNHREGLSVFVDRPQTPMDNNAAERALRGPVIGRRLSFGSVSETGARFAAMMYSVLGTLASNGIDALRWLDAWLTTCAENDGRAPGDLSAWLPWSMSTERRRALMAPG